MSISERINSLEQKIYGDKHCCTDPEPVTIIPVASSGTSSGKMLMFVAIGAVAGGSAAYFLLPDSDEDIDPVKEKLIKGLAGAIIGAIVGAAISHSF